MKRQPGRFDEPGAQYVIRPSSVEGGRPCPPLPSGALQQTGRVSPWYEGAGAPPVQIPLPDVTDRPCCVAQAELAFEVPPALQNLLLGSRRSARGKKSGGGSFTIGDLRFSLRHHDLRVICLNIFLSLFDLIFRWMFFIKICIPFPKKSEG